MLSFNFDTPLEEHLCGECFDMMNHDATFAEAHDAAFEDPRGHGSG